MLELERFWRSCMHFGVDIWLFYPRYSVGQALKNVEKAGFKYIEYPYEYFRDYEERELEARVKEIAEVSQSYSVEPYQLHAPYGDLCYQLASSDEKIRERATRKLEEWVRYASILGVSVLVVHFAFTRPHQQLTYVEAARRVAEINVKLARRLSKAGEEYGVKIAFENCVEPWFGASPADVLWLISEVGSEHLGACLDTGHANVNRIDVALAVKQLAHSLIATHLHDNNSRHDQHYPPLMGTIDWKRMMRSFKDINYKYPLIFEIPGNWGRSGDINQLELLKIVAHHLNSLV